MSRQDIGVEIHLSGRGGEVCPAVNIKVYGALNDRIMSDVGTYMTISGDPDLARGFDMEWVEGLGYERTTDIWWDVCAWEFEYFSEYGYELLAEFGQKGSRGINIWQVGRQGGWAIVEGLPDIEVWAEEYPELVEKWRIWEEAGKAIAGNIPTLFAEQLWVNIWMPAIENVARGEN